MEDSITETQIIEKIKNISFNDAIKDYHKLTNLYKKGAYISAETRIGNKFVDYFTFKCRLNTQGVKKMSYWEFLQDKEYQSRPYIKRLIEYQEQKGIEHYTALYSIFKLHAGSLGLFKPCRTMELLLEFPSTRILDPCMGWGCRMVGACISDAVSYIGIDTNKELIEPHHRMKETLNGLGCRTYITTMYEDAAEIDYSRFSYDCVLTSPPYYNLEIYKGTKAKSISEWNAWYRTVFSKTYKYLLVDGYFIINILKTVYEDVLISLLGEAHYILPFKKKSKPNAKANEFIYIWKKAISPIATEEQLCLLV